MDIFRAKRYLIITFTLVNIFLVFSLLFDTSLMPNDFDDLSMKNLKILMKEKNIEYDRDLSNETEKVYILKGQFRQTNDPIYDKIYEDQENISDGEGMKLKVITMANIIPFDKENAIKYGKSFLENHLDLDYELKNYTAKDDKVYMTFKEKVRDRVIKDSYVDFEVTTNGDVNISIIGMEVSDKSNYKVSTISPANAVALSLNELEGKKIKSIEKCYSGMQEGDNLKNTAETTLFPFYCINTTDGKTHYVNAILDKN